MKKIEETVPYLYANIYIDPHMPYRYIPGVAYNDRDQLELEAIYYGRLGIPERRVGVVVWKFDHVEPTTEEPLEDKVIHMDSWKRRK